ncbi:MAG: EAL domain-containing protein, partial [Solirubrobacteraceae bacterium]|nr:EAL domain-containing protein [Solirubrobacteraceae bacterium]
MKSESEHTLLLPPRSDGATDPSAICLRQAELFDLAFQKAPIGMALVGRQGEWLQVNDQLCAFLGRSEQELLDTTFQALTHPDDMDQQAIVDLREGRLDRYSIEKRYHHKSGRWVSARISTAPLRAADGTPEVYVTQVHDITAELAASAELERAAVEDALTGLGNRRRIEGALEAASAGEGGVAMIIDLDGFKSTNDGFGHVAGDQVLRAVADRLKDCIGPDDVAGRIGGDEFVVVLPGSSTDDALDLGADLCGWIAATDVWIDGHTRISPTASIGLADIGAGEYDITDILLAADMAMYEAKSRGGNQAISYGAELAGSARGRTDLHWLATLRRALTEHHFELHAQAIVDLSTGVAVKHELLLRLRDPETGAAIYPGDFLPAAERLKLMRELDEWVVAEAASTAARYPGSTLGINLSGSSVGDPSLPGRIEQLLEHSACDPAQLVFEITETEAIENLNQARTFTERLHSLGCRFALDDFGSGYASFAHLKQLPLEFIKIDGEFIRHLPDNRDDQLIVEAIQFVARGMDRKVVAEQIEDEATAELLRGMGVEFGQGYHFAR